MKKLGMSKRPKDELADLHVTGNVNSHTFGDEEARESHKKQTLRYYEGNSTSAKNDPYSPSDASGPNGLGEVIDRSTKKPYGKQGMGWSEKSGKLGDLDPKERDQPSWVGSWSPLMIGPSVGHGAGAGMVPDENYSVQRPRTFSRQRDRFNQVNPEFQDVADPGDWTSYEWSENV